MTDQKHSKRVERFLKTVDSARRQLDYLEREGPALLDADSLAAGRDGYGAGGTQEGRGKGDHSDPVLNAVQAVLDGKQAKEGEPENPWDLSKTLDSTYDPVRENAANLMASVKQTLRDVDKARDSIRAFKSIQRVDGRHSNEPTHCKACDRLVECTTNDPLRSLYCDQCGKSWDRWVEVEDAAGRLSSDPGENRLRFERSRRARLAGDALAADPEPVAPTCQHSCCVGEDRGISHLHEREPGECADCQALELAS